jgi:hypothetical protein
MIQRQQKMNIFALHAKRFAAGRQDMYPGSLLVEVFGERGRCPDDVLTVVENEQEPALRKEGYESWHRVLCLPAQR